MSDDAERQAVYRQISDAVARVLAAADHLVNEFTRADAGHGTGVGMRAAEDRLIREVQAWRGACRGETVRDKP